MATIYEDNDFFFKGLDIAGSSDRVFHGVVFDGSWNLLCGYGTSTSHPCSFVAVGQKKHKATGVVTRGILGAVAPASYGINALETLIDGDPDYSYNVSVFVCNQHTSTEIFYLGFQQ